MSSHEIREYQDSDAHDVAVLFNESNDVWPGGFTQGKELKAEDVRRWVEQGDALALYVAVEDDHVRGYCSLLKSICEIEDSCYVGLLGATPKYHGRGHGRDMLRASIAKSIEKGVRQVDLHTWAGNLKAVPLYKKTGFNWVPQTSVLMRNFIPMIALAEIASPFFDGVDWYEIHDRELDLNEDKEVWDGVEVFSYRFKRDGKTIHAKINRFAREIVYFENDDVRVCLKKPEEKPLRGRSLDMVLEVENKTGNSCELSYKAFGSGGIACDATGTSSIEGINKMAIPFEISHKTLKGGLYDLYPVSGVEVEINGKKLKLGIGHETKPVVMTAVYPRHPVMSANLESAVKIELTNNSEHELDCQLMIDPPNEDIVTGKIAPVKIEAGGKRSVDLALKMKESRVLPVKVEYSNGGEINQTGVTDIPIMVSDNFETSRLEFTDNRFFNPKEVILRDGLVLESQARGGSCKLFDPREQNPILSFPPVSFGPPFDPSAMEYSTFEHEQSGRNSIQMSARVDKNPDLAYIRKITLLGGGWVAVDHLIRNKGKVDSSITIKARVNLGGESGELCYPCLGKIQSGMREHEGYPANDEIPRKFNEWDEGWISMANKEEIKAILFDDDASCFSMGWSGNGLEYEFDSIPAGTEVKTKTMYVYSGPGTVDDIRRAWFRLVKGQYHDIGLLEKVTLRSVNTSPMVPVVSGESTFKVLFENQRMVDAEGIIMISTDESIEVDKPRHEFKNVKRGEPFEEDINISTVDNSVGVASLKLRLESISGAAESKVTVLRTDKSEKVKIEKAGNELIVSNGLASFRLDPDFGGGIHSFKALDKEWLKLGYPDKNFIFCWYNPWRGGIRPVLRNKNDWMDSVYNEEWAVSEFSEKVGDLEFQGIETQATIKDLKNLEGVVVKMRFLLSEGHRILRLVYVLDNIQDISYSAVGGFWKFNNIDNQQKTTQHFEYGTETERRSGPFGGYHPVDWLITENHDDGKSLLLVKPKPTKEYHVKTNIWLADHGEPYGQHASYDFDLDVKAGEKQEYPLFLVPCKDLDEASKMKGIKNL